MVNQEIVNYLKEGKKRGFSLQILKQKLLEGGFDDKDVNLAISEINRLEVNSRPIQPQQIPQKPLVPNKQSFPNSQPIQQNVRSIPPNLISNPSAISNQSKPNQLVQTPQAQQNQNLQQKPLVQNQQPVKEISPQSFNSLSSSKLPTLNNQGQSQKQTLPGNPISLWLKISGVLGIAILLFSFIFSFAVISLKNTLVSIIYVSIILIFSIVYAFGYFKLGKRIDSKIMKLASIFIVILLFLALVIVIISAISENKILQSFAALASNSNNSFAAFLIISSISIFILFIISKLLLSISLIQNKEKVHLAGLTGLISLLTCIFSLISLILFFIIMFANPQIFLNIAENSFSEFGEVLIKISTIGLMLVIIATISATLKLITIILEIIMLFKNSRNL